MARAQAAFLQVDVVLYPAQRLGGHDPLGAYLGQGSALRFDQLPADWSRPGTIMMIFAKHVAGIVGLVAVGLAAYCVLAFELEGQQRRPVLPTFRRRRAALAMTDGIPAQLDGIAHEAGVRQTT